MIELTQSALAAIQKYCKEDNTQYFKVSVTTGGCSGFSYNTELTNMPLATDEQLNFGSVIVLVDELSKPFLKGCKIDYVDTIGHSGFSFTNPNASGSCGCGISFTVDS